MYVISNSKVFQHITIKACISINVTFFIVSCRYLFWTERGGLVRQINLATYATLTLANESEPYAIAVDCTKKLVYWFVQKFGFNHVSLSDYHGKNNYTIESKLESFREHLVGVFGEMLPMQKKGKLYINLQNESKAINRDLEIDTAYYELILVDSNFQPISE